MSAWKFLITDRFGNPIGELEDAESKSVSLRLKRITTGSFTIETFNSLANQVRNTDQVFVKAYRKTRLKAAGPIVPNYQKSVQPESKTIQCNWAGVGWRLGNRIIESSKTAAGVLYPSTLGSTTPRGTIVSNLINELHDPTVGSHAFLVAGGASKSVLDTGVRVGSLGTTNPTQVGPWSFKNALQAIMELAAPLDGFDWDIVPNEPVADSVGVKWGTFTCANAFGSTKPDIVWEYGDGKHNVASFVEIGDFSGPMNLGYSVDQTTATGSNILTTPNIPSMNSRGTLYEGVIASDLVTDVMRQDLLNQSVAIRSIPKTVVTFQPSPTLGVGYSYDDDYVIGDIVRFRAVEHGQETVNGLFRIYGVDFDIDKQGNETATPILISQDA